jgi:serine O-acetyltransferase
MWKQWQYLKEDISVVFERDPAARSIWEVIFAYPGFHAVFFHRLAHWLWTHNLKTLGRLVSHLSRFLTGVEIHPAVKVGRRLFIDHGMGVVIGETAEIGNDVTFYQGVSLAGTSRERVKRHPTIEDWVLIGSGATVLGPVTIGRHSRVGAGSVVVNSVPPHANLPDPIFRALSTLLEHVERMEKRMEEMTSRQGLLEERITEGDEDLQRVRLLFKNAGSA